MTMLCEKCAGLTFRVERLEKSLCQPVHWPVWFADIQAGVAEVEAVTRELGLPVNTLWTVSHHRADTEINRNRAKLIWTLHERGWPASKIAMIARTSDRAVRRAFRQAARLRDGVTHGGKTVAGRATGAKCGVDE
jgi:hypothetical protein